MVPRIRSGSGGHYHRVHQQQMQQQQKQQCYQPPTAGAMVFWYCDYRPTRLFALALTMCYVIVSLMLIHHTVVVLPPPTARPEKEVPSSSSPAAGDGLKGGQSNTYRRAMMAVPDHDHHRQTTTRRTGEEPSSSSLSSLTTSSSSSSIGGAGTGSGLCVVIGIFSRGSEQDLRRWQRRHFGEFEQRRRRRRRRESGGSGGGGGGGDGREEEAIDDEEDHDEAIDDMVRLRFPVAYKKNDTALDELLEREQRRHGDLVFLPMAENYRWLTAATFEFLKIAAPLLDSSPSSKAEEEEANVRCPLGQYVVKADSDVVISYENLLAILRAQSGTASTGGVHLGQMQPDTPVHHPLIRRTGSLTDSTLPVWSVGQIYVLSLDLVQTLIRDDVVRTVLKAEEGYVYPEEDRSIGLALSRAQIHVPRRVHLPRLYLFCQVQDLLGSLNDNDDNNDDDACDRYLRDFTAIGVGFGLSGSGNAFKDGKLKLLDLVSRKAKQCHHHRTANALTTTTAPQTLQRLVTTSTRSMIMDEPEQFFVVVDDTFRQPDVPQQYFFDNCPSLSATGELMKQEFLGDAKRRDDDFVEAPRLERECAEAAYWQNHPQFQTNTTTTTQSARDHFLSEGSKHNSSSYYCPDACFNATCPQCDREAAYTHSYPDIAQAVQSGAIENGTVHFTKYGQHEGRVFPCFPRYIDPGYGSNQGCEAVFQKFVNATRPAVAKWPVFGKADFGGSGGQNAIVFCEGRQKEWTDYVLRVARRFTGPDWLFYLVGPPDLTRYWKEHYTGPQLQIVTIPPSFGNLSVYPDQINKLYRSDFLWRDTVDRENVLVLQSDALLLRHGVEDFFAYDYVGSPVYPESFPDMNWRILCAKHFRCGGNGGLSFRKRSAILHALDHCTIPKDSLDEDQWYSACLAESGMNLPHPIIANRFSVGSKCNIDVPFGIHKPWQNCKESTCTAALVESQLYADIYGDDHQSNDDHCEEGNAYYLRQNKDVAAAYPTDGRGHYVEYGKKEGRRWFCFDNVTAPQLRVGPYTDIPSTWMHRSAATTAASRLISRIRTPRDDATSPLR